MDADYRIWSEHAGDPHGTQSDQDICWCHLLEQRGVPLVPKCPLWLEMDVMDVFVTHPLGAFAHVSGGRGFGAAAGGRASAGHRSRGTQYDEQILRPTRPNLTIPTPGPFPSGSPLAFGRLPITLLLLSSPFMATLGSLVFFHKPSYEPWIA